MLQQRGGGIRKFACVPNHHCKMWNITTCIRYCLLVATHTTTYSLNLRGLLDLSVNDPGGPSTRGGALKVMKACAGIMQARVTKKKTKKRGYYLQIIERLVQAGAWTHSDVRHRTLFQALDDSNLCVLFGSLRIQKSRGAKHWPNMYTGWGFQGFSR